MSAKPDWKWKTIEDKAPQKGKYAGCQVLTVTFARTCVQEDGMGTALNGDQMTEFGKKAAELLTKVESGCA